MADAMAPKRKYCVNCLADATAVRVRCDDCSDMELCLECFASGAELGPHRRGHAFRLEDAGTFPLFDDPGGAAGTRAAPWSCLEEQQLLEAVEQHGLGNWADVGAQVNAAWCSAMGGPAGSGGGGGGGGAGGPVAGGAGGGGGGGAPAGAAAGGGPGARSSSDVARHFVAAYVYGSVGRACVPEVIPNRVTDHTPPEPPPADRAGSSPPPPPAVPPISAEEQQTLGYMPLRDDFEMEFLPHAETPVSELPSFEPDEVALVADAARSSASSSSLLAALDHHDGAQLLELELKMAVVCEYVRALQQRELRKAAARDYGLVQAFFGQPCALQAAYAAAAAAAQPAGSSPAAAGANPPSASAPSQAQEPPAKRRMAKEEKELLLKLRPLCRLVPARELVVLLEGARRERGLRERVRELQRARARGGVRRLDEFAAALRRHRRRFGQAQQQQQQGAGSGGGGGAGGHNGRERGDAAAGSADGEADDPCGYARALSEREAALCSSVNLSPAQYVNAKTIALLQSSTHKHARRLQQQQQAQQQQQQVLGQQQQGKGRPQGAAALGQGALPMLLEKAVRKKLMGFLGRSGWVGGGAGGKEVL